MSGSSDTSISVYLLLSYQVIPARMYFSTGKEVDRCIRQGVSSKACARRGAE